MKSAFCPIRKKLSRSAAGILDVSEPRKGFGRPRGQNPHGLYAAPPSRRLSRSAAGILDVSEPRKGFGRPRGQNPHGLYAAPPSRRLSRSAAGILDVSEPRRDLDGRAGKTRTASMRRRRVGALVAGSARCQSRDDLDSAPVREEGDVLRPWEFLRSALQSPLDLPPHGLVGDTREAKAGVTMRGPPHEARPGGVGEP